MFDGIYLHRSRKTNVSGFNWLAYFLCRAISAYWYPKICRTNTIAGMSVFTNQAIRSRVLHMEGRFLRTDPSAELLLALETALQEQTTFTAVLDGIRYRMCRLSQYRIQEDGHSGTVACQLDCLVSQLEAVEEKVE